MSGEIKEITQETNIKELKKTTYDGDVEIYGNPYRVVRLYGYYHSKGGKWGNNDLYMYPRNEEPSYENLVEFNCSEIGPTYGIKYEPHNYIKNKYGLTSFTTGGAMITRNGKDFYYCIRGINEALDKISIIKEHPLGIGDIDYDKKMIGRKVWWRSEPGIITRFIHGQACVIIEPDGIEKFSTPAEFIEDDILEDEDDYIKTDIFDKHIWWFRD